MPLLNRRSAFAPPPSLFEQQLVPVASVMLGSLLAVVPLIATAPVLPPFGLLMLLGWRVSRTALWPAWAALPLGLFDDLLSGQPIGSAMALWTVALLLLDYCDIRILWRGYWQDWGLSALIAAGVLLAQWALVQFSGGATPAILILPQIAIAAMLFPVIARFCATLDRWRIGR